MEDVNSENDVYLDDNYFGVRIERRVLIMYAVCSLTLYFFSFSLLECYLI